MELVCDFSTLGIGTEGLEVEEEYCGHCSSIIEPSVFSVEDADSGTSYCDFDCYQEHFGLASNQVL